MIFELVGDLLVVGELGLKSLVDGGLARVEAADDHLEQVVQLVCGFSTWLQGVLGLRGGFGWRRRRLAPNQIEPREGFRANSPGESHLAR